MELYLIRHTTPDVDAGVCYGQSDINVAASFPTEAQTVRQKLAAIQPVIMYTSPACRCQKLARLLAEHWETSGPVEDIRLKELHFGEWEMQRWDDISLRALERWGASYIHEAPPGGESFKALHQRASAFLSDLQSTSVASAVVVTHAGVIRALLSDVMQLPLNETFKLTLDYGGITHLSFQDGMVKLVQLNG